MATKAALQSVSSHGEVLEAQALRFVWRYIERMTMS